MTKRKIIPYNSKLKQLARNLRNNSTFAEVILWNYLKGKNMQGYDFHRQKPVDSYIVDFYCSELMLAIEIDGHTHGDKIKEDALRQQRLENFGIRFLRFYDSDVKNNTDAVLFEIGEWIITYETHPQPLSRGELEK